jgi:hypothetical protein
MALPRNLTAQEKIDFHNDFPLLDVDFTIVTDEPTGNYNCISWTVGVTNLWYWPGPLLSDFDNFYSQFGMQQKTKGFVAAWGFAEDSMTHGCISGATHGPKWESKCGGWARIQHCLHELNGPDSNYGHVIVYYGWKKLIVGPFYPKYLIKFLKEERKFSKEEMNLLRSLIKDLPGDIVADFENKFSALKRSWFKGNFSSGSDPYSRTKTKEYRELTTLGKIILPLLANKMTNDSNFLALPAFEQLAKDKKMIIRIDSADERILEGEQGRAYRTVKNYLAGR